MPPASKTTAAPPPSKARQGAAAGVKAKGSLRDKVTAGVSAAQPELAPALQAENQLHNKIFGGKGKLQPGAPGRLVLVEFLVCFVVLGLGTIVAPEGKKNAGAAHLAVKGSALALLFFILALMAGGGGKAAKAADALGGLVTAAYVFTSADSANLVKWISAFFDSGKTTTTAPTGTEAHPGGGSGTAAGSGLGGLGATLGQAAGAVAGAAQ